MDKIRFSRYEIMEIEARCKSFIAFNIEKLIY